MTTTDTTPRWFDPGFYHAAARGKALDALIEVAESIGTLPITSLGIEAGYGIRVQLEYAGAVELAARWSAGEPVTSQLESGATHFVWEFDLDSGPMGREITRVRIYALVSS